MSQRLKTYNTIYKILDKSSINLLYRPSNTLFDLILPLLDIDMQYYGDSNSYSYSYDAYMASNPLEHSHIRNNILFDYGIPDIIGFHSLVPHKFKKEDLYIFKRSSIKNYKIFFDDKIRDSWGIRDRLTYNLNYGLPPQIVESKSKKKSIVVLNLSNNSTISTLYQYIKNQFKDAEMITSTNSMTYEQILNKLAEYNVCLEHDTLINCLVAAYAGCHIISSLPSIPNIEGSFNIDDYRTVFQTINNLINTRTESNKQQLLETYSFDLFSTQFIQCLYEIKKVSPIL